MKMYIVQVNMIIYCSFQVSGSRIANNQVVTPTSLTSISAYVQQDDLFIGTLTVREHLTFLSLVRMDKHVGQKERRERIEQVIEQVPPAKHLICH